MGIIKCQQYESQMYTYTCTHNTVTVSLIQLLCERFDSSNLLLPVAVPPTCHKRTLSSRSRWIAAIPLPLVALAQGLSGGPNAKLHSFARSMTTSRRPSYGGGGLHT